MVNVVLDTDAKEARIGPFRASVMFVLPDQEIDVGPWRDGQGRVADEDAARFLDTLLFMALAANWELLDEGQALAP